MKKYLVPAALLIGITWDILFWKKIPGVSFPIFVGVCLVAGDILLRSEKLPLSRRSLFLIALILFFSIMTFIRKDVLTSFLNYSLSLSFFFLLSATCQGGLWISYSLFDYIVNSLRLFGNMFALPWKFLAEPSASRKKETFKQQPSLALQIARGLLLALPILAIFTLLLSSADLVFAQKFEDFISYLRIENLGEFIAHGIVIFSIAYFYIGIIRYAAKRAGKEKLIGIEKPVITPFLGFTEASVVLGSVIILFTAFVFIQFRYLFSGEMYIDSSGFTYAEYARRGFGELVAVAFISLLLIQSFRAILKHKNANQRKLFARIVIALVVLVLVILASAFQRLSLYESAYGFSSLRTYAHVFIIWLGLLLVGVVILEFLKQTRAFANLVLLVMVGFALTLNMLNVDAFIVRQNIKRAAAGQELDSSYLARLSSDAIPALVSAFQSETQTEDIKESVGAALACQRLAIENELLLRSTWQSFHYSDWYAARQMSIIQELLEGYQVVEDDYIVEVVSPRGKTIACQY